MTCVKLNPDKKQLSLNDYGVRTCPWDGVRFRARTTGGRLQRYCSPVCKRAHEAALKAWAAKQEAMGTVTIEELRNLRLLAGIKPHRKAKPPTEPGLFFGMPSPDTPPDTLLSVPASEPHTDGSSTSQSEPAYDEATEDQQTQNP